MATNEGCKFVYSLVQVHIPHPIQLITFTLKGGKDVRGMPAPMCFKRVSDLVMAGTCTYQHFHNKATTFGSALVDAEDLQVLVRLEVVPPSTPQVTTITCTQVVRCLGPKVFAKKVAGLTGIKALQTRCQGGLL